jgi:hypothetical protein
VYAFGREVSKVAEFLAARQAQFDSVNEDQAWLCAWSSPGTVS